MYFEQAYYYGEDKLLHIDKLAPRWPGSISEIKMATDGGLEFIKQYAALGGKDAAPLLPEPIPVDKLVAYINEQEGTWFGRSAWRAAYKHFLRKDRLLRVDAVKHERNGMGVPITEASPGASKPQMIQAQQLTEQYKVGELSSSASSTR